MVTRKSPRHANRATSRKPLNTPEVPHGPNRENEPLTDGNWIWCPLKGEWRVLLPEEYVRQGFILTLHFRYGYEFDQMDQERKTKHGRKSPKADIVVWETIEAKNSNRAPIIVVECKSDNITIVPDDYDQGDSYARAIGDPCEFLVMHNNKETKFFRITRGLPGSREDIETIPMLADLGNAAKMDAIRRSTKAFSREEFRRLLFDCHSILRDNHKMEPGRAFDEISKILFIKMYIERTGNLDKFTLSYLDEYARIRRRKLEEVMDDLFEDTKRHYRADELFSEDDHLNISFATFRRIVQLLERFNLGATSDDIKGIAFERFLGQTFRGDLGQFFTPRPIVDFVVEFMNSQETDVMCDPASGSGGFLIKHFEYVRAQIEKDVHEAKQTIRTKIESEHLDEDASAAKINAEFARLNEDLDVSQDDSRLWTVAHQRIFGTDAEPRAARTSKMNMIMHGDGHGGIHHHDGLVDVNGIFPGRFDVVMTNPPFGAKVEDDQVVGDTAETQVDTAPDDVKKNIQLYGDAYRQSHERMLQAAKNREKILALFDVSRDAKSEKTEVLFLERCLKLLKPGGRVGIVVPDGILNNPSQVDVREYIEQRARVLAVVSIPDKTFRSSKTNVKASLLFLMRLTAKEEAARRRLMERLERAERTKSKKQYNRLRQALDISWREYAATTAESSTKRMPGTGAIRKLVTEVYGQGLDLVTFTQKKAEIRALCSVLSEGPHAKAEEAVKKAYDYDIFMAVADHVGIRASGKEDPSNDLPEILSCWRDFVADPGNISDDVRNPFFKIKWSNLDRWDPTSFKPIDWQCAPELLKPLGSVLRQRTELVDREEYDFSELTPITIHFDGSIDPRDTSDADEYTMELFFAKPNDIVVSKIDLKNGAVGVVPPSYQNVVVTNHFVVYEPILELVYPPYLMRMIQTDFFKGYLWRKKVGSEGRKEVKMELFEATLIPLPDVPTQRQLVAKWIELETSHQRLVAEMAVERSRLNEALLVAGP